MCETNVPPRRAQRGMSLVEVMVAMVIGMIGCIVVFQVFSVAESRKRTISAGSDMDVSGRLGLMALVRDIQLAGYGYGQAAAANATSSGSPFGCTVNAHDALRSPTAFSFTLAPVIITQGASGAVDTITVLQGSSNLMVGLKTIDLTTNTTKRIKTNTGGRTGAQRGDVVVSVASTPSLGCAMYEITGDSNGDQLTLDHATGTYTTAAGQSKTARYNSGASTPSFTMTGEGKLLNLGATPFLNAWSVSGGKLIVSNGITATGNAEAADGIVNLQAQYGYDANGDGIIASTEWQTTTPTDWTRVLAVRVAILARGQYEIAQVTTTAPQWSEGAFTMTNVDGTADGGTGLVGPNNWRNYRYNVFEAVVPLKNVLWGSKAT